MSNDKYPLLNSLVNNLREQNIDAKIKLYFSVPEPKYIVKISFDELLLYFKFNKNDDLVFIKKKEFNIFDNEYIEKKMGNIINKPYVDEIKYIFEYD